MENPLDRVYRKTDMGVAEVKSRSVGLSARACMALIVVNGVDSVAVLRDRVGSDAGPLIERLAVQGQVEVVVQRARSAPSLLPASRDIAQDPPPVAPGVSGADEVELPRPLRREALVRLATHHGPAAAVVAGPLLQAKTLKTYGAALNALKTKLSVYLGRKQAIKLLAGV